MPASSWPAVAASPGRDWSCSPRSPASTGQMCPVPARSAPTAHRSCAQIVSESGCVAVAVAVAVVAQPAGAGRRRLLDGGVDDTLSELRDVRVGRRQLTEADQLEEAGVDDGALVEGRAAVVEVVDVAALGSPVLDSRMKYGSVDSGPFVVTVQPLMLRW